MKMEKDNTWTMIIWDDKEENNHLIWWWGFMLLKKQDTDQTQINLVHTHDKNLMISNFN